jgi:hypothetical protein
MFQRIKPHLTYANVMSSIAVFAVLGGGAYAGIDRKIRTADLGKNVVTTPKLAKQAVGTGKVKAQAIRRGKINDGAVRRSKIFDNAVNAEKLANNAVETDKIANQAVETDKIAEAAVQHGKIADGAILEQKLADQAVSTEKLGNGAVTGSKVSQVLIRRSTVPLNNNTNASAQATCEEGERIIGGGGNVGAFLDIDWLSSRPALAGGGVPADGSELTHWRSSARNTSGTNTTLNAYALCLS